MELIAMILPRAFFLVAFQTARNAARSRFYITITQLPGVAEINLSSRPHFDFSARLVALVKSGNNCNGNMAMKDDEEEEKESYVGRSVKKFFSGFGIFHGKVISFNRTLRFYKVKYDDGDREEVDLKELKEILVAKELLPSADKPKSRRGRKRRRDSFDKYGTSEAGNPLGAEASEHDKIPGYNFVQETEVEELSPSRVEETSNLKEMLTRQLGTNNEAGEEQEDEHLLEPLIPIALAKVFEKGVKPLIPSPSGHLGDERGKKRIGESGKPVLVQTTPPCRLKRARVTPTSDSCLQQMPRVEDDKGEGQEGTETVNVEGEYINMAGVPLPPVVIEDISKRELDNNFNSGKGDKQDTIKQDKQDTTKFSSFVLSLPPSSKSLGGLDHCAAELFQVYSVLRSFSTVIFLSPFSLEEFAFALSLTDVCSIIDCVHLSLLQTLRRQLERLSKHGSKSATFTLRLADWSLLDYITWPSFLVAYLLTQGFNFDKGHSFVKEGLLTVEYYKLPIRTKLTILSFLCNKVLDTEEARAELARRAILENDSELTEIKGYWQKKQAKESTGLEVQVEDEPVTELSTRQENSAVSVQAVVLETSSPSAANSIRVGRHLDEDGNLDECVLCAMDGNLICCDGCPAAYHSRCVGVTRQGLPPGDWFCPECRADKQDPRGARISKGVRGGEVLGIGPDGQLIFHACGYLLVSETSAEGQAIHRYYSPRDLHKVIQFLEQAGPIYAQLQIAVQQLCQAGTNGTMTPAACTKILAPDVPSSVVLPSGNELSYHEKQSGSFQPGGEGPMEVDKSFSASDSLPSEQTHVDVHQSYLYPTLTNFETHKIFASSSINEEFEKKLDLCVPDWKQANGSISDTIDVSLPDAIDVSLPDAIDVSLPEAIDLNMPAGEYDKKYYLCSDEYGKQVNGKKQCYSTVDSEIKELDNMWGLHADHDPQKQTTMASTESPSNDQILEFRTGHVANLVSLSSTGGVSAGPCSGQNGTNGSRDMEDGKIVSLGAVQVLHANAWVANGTISKSFSDQQQIVAQVNCPGKCTDARKAARSGRNSEREEDYMSTLTQINACAYTNRYANCDFVATAAFNLAVMAGGVDDLVDDKAGTLKKTKPTSVGDQVKAFTQASGHFFWPSSKKKAKDGSKEKCGWCIHCRSTCRRACLLTQVAGQMAGGAALVVGGIRPIKVGYGHFAAVAAYILYMEENLLGLLEGPWELPGHRKRWRKQVEQAKSLKEVTLSLLQMESSLRRVALLPDWDKVEEDAPESIANSAAIITLTGLLTSKKTSSKKRGRPPVVTKSPAVISYDGACFGLKWWRGGDLSRRVYNWESLSRTAIKRAGRRGGFREISDLVYSKGLDLPRRTRRFAWQTRLEKISSIAQVALEIRHLDTFIKWNDIISPLEATTTHTIKGPSESDPAFWKAEIRAKSNESDVVKYLLGFPKEVESKDTSTHSPEEIALKGIGATMEKSTNKKQQAATKEVSNDSLKEELWVAQSDVPLFLLKDFEEKMRTINHSKLPKSLKKGKGKATPQQKKMSFWKMLCTPRLAAVLDSKKLSSWICGYCQLTGSESQCVKCQKCYGTFHRKCTQVEDSSSGQEKVLVCKICIKQRLGQRMRKPSYKMLVMQSQLADGSPVVYSKEALVSNNTEGASKGGAKLKWKKNRLSESSQPQHELSGRKKRKSLLSVPTPAHHPNESTWMERKGSCKKKKGLVTIIPSQHEGDSVQVGKKKFGKRKKTLSIAVSQLESHEGNNLPQPKKRGRKKKVVSLVPSKPQSMPPQGRRTSGRIRNSISPSEVIPQLVPANGVRKRGRPKSVYKVDKELFQPPSVPHHKRESSMLTRRRTGCSRDSVSGSAAAQHEEDGTEIQKKSPVKRKRLKIIFAGLEVGSRNVNKNGGHEEEQTRKSGHGLDYGSRSAKSEAEIQRFRQERLVLEDQVGLDSGNAPVCSLCSAAYFPGHLYVSCEYCEDWFHGDAVGLKPGDAAFLVGFKCHRCRKCRAPSCPVVRNAGAGVKTRRRGAIDHGEVIDAENVNKILHFESGSSLQSSWLNSPDKEFSAFSDAKAFPDFVAATNQAEEALAADGSNFGHDVLSQDFDMSDLVLAGDSQLQLNPLSLGDQQGSVWTNNGSVQLDLPAFSASQADISSRGAPSLSFTELLASDDDYFEGVTGSGLGLSAAWTEGMYGSANAVNAANVMAPVKPCAGDDTTLGDLDRCSLPVNENKATSQKVSFSEKVAAGNDCYMEERAAAAVNKEGGDGQKGVIGKDLAAASK